MIAGAVTLRIHIHDSFNQMIRKWDRMFIAFNVVLGSSTDMHKSPLGWTWIQSAPHWTPLFTFVESPTIPCHPYPMSVVIHIDSLSDCLPAAASVLSLRNELLISDNALKWNLSAFSVQTGGGKIRPFLAFNYIRPYIFTMKNAGNLNASIF